MYLPLPEVGGLPVQVFLYGEDQTFSHIGVGSGSIELMTNDKLPKQVFPEKTRPFPI